MLLRVDSAGFQEGQQELLAGWMAAGQGVEQGAAGQWCAVSSSPFLQFPVGHAGSGADLPQALGELLDGLGHGGVDIVLWAGHAPGIQDEVSDTVRQPTDGDPQTPASALNRLDTAGEESGFVRPACRTVCRSVLLSPSKGGAPR